MQMSTAEAPFQFNFGAPGDLPSATQASAVAADQQSETLSSVEVRPPYQLSPSLQLDQVALTDALYLLKGRVSSAAAAFLVKDANLQSSDLEPGKYEGGFKLWECAVDLAQHLCKEYNLDKLISSKTDPNHDLVGKRVLELGCGQGLPGIVPLLAGADVHFQDFNQEVLTSLTSQNVTANRQRLPKSRRPVSARYFGGDWGTLGSLMASENLGGSYDMILSAETIYNLESQQQLFNCIKQAIKPPTGVAYIAAKTYYFGVGGGTTSFKKLLKRDGMLEVHTVATFDEGDGNKREILKLKFPDHIIPYFL